MQRSQLTLVPRCHVRAVLDEESCKMQITPSGQLVQLSVPVIVLDILDEEVCEIEMTRC